MVFWPLWDKSNSGALLSGAVVHPGSYSLWRPSTSSSSSGFLQTFTYSAAGWLPAASWVELVSALPKHRVWGKPGSLPASRKRLIRPCLPPTKSILSGLLPAYAGTRNQRFSFLYFPQSSYGHGRGFEMVGAENLIFHPMLSSKLLISHVFAQISLICHILKNIHTSKLSLGFGVSVPSCSLAIFVLLFVCFVFFFSFL